jgi:hypothetical protein
MVALNDAIFEAYDPYFSIITSVKKEELASGIYRLLPTMIDIANGGSFTENNIARSLRALSKFLKAHYEVPCIVFIDEYDTPYDTAYQYGYYEEAQPIMAKLLNLLLKVLLLSHS